MWHDVCVCAHSFVVSQILSGDTREVVVENIHTRLQEVGEKVRNNELPIELYHITKVTGDSSCSVHNDWLA